MLRVTVEIWPGGDSSRARRMAVIDIANESGLAPVSDYSVKTMLNPGQLDEKPFVGTVRGHQRKLGWVALVRRCLQQADDFIQFTLAKEAGDTDRRA